MLLAAMTQPKIGSSRLDVVDVCAASYLTSKKVEEGIGK